MSVNHRNRKFRFSIDRGGTFTDLHCILPDGKEIVEKLLSEDPNNYKDAPTEGIRRILAKYDSENDYDKNKKLYSGSIHSVRMATTVATNALLERKGEKTGLIITKGFRDLLQIGNQSRDNIFDLSCFKSKLLYDHVEEVDERIILGTFLKGGTRSNAFSKEESTYNLNTNKKKHNCTKTNSTNSDNENTYEEYFHSAISKKGITNDEIKILQAPLKSEIQHILENFKIRNIKSLAIVLLHSYTYDIHEQYIATLAKEMNYFKNISLSSEVMPMIKMTSRGSTACAAAYLTPIIKKYIDSFITQFDNNFTKNVKLSFMKSDGGLIPFDQFGGHQAILSGPAGGVIGYAKTAYRGNFKQISEQEKKSHNNQQEDLQPVIGLDMGGTSTDVSRYDGSLELVFETKTADVEIQSPQLDIHTVAAGGGSRLYLRSGMFHVGPESAGAHPGPICYRKNGYLTITDANLVLGRLLPQYFPSIFGPNENEPLDLKSAWNAFEALRIDEYKHFSVEELAYGFLKVANEAMCRPIRNLTQMRGHDITTHNLACFGGAGPQHACAIAKALGMSRVYIHRHSGVLSAYGLSMSDAVHEEQEPAADVYEKNTIAERENRLARLEEKASHVLMKQGYSIDNILLERYMSLRFKGTDTSVMIKEPDHEEAAPPSKSFSYLDAFHSHYIREYGVTMDGRTVEIDAYRVRAVVPGLSLTSDRIMLGEFLGEPEAVTTSRAYFEDGWNVVKIYDMEKLAPGHEVIGPSIIVKSISTIVIETDCMAFITSQGNLEILIGKKSVSDQLRQRGNHDCTTIQLDDSHHNAKDNTHRNVDESTLISLDPVQLSIFSHRFMGVAEQMGRTLQRTAISVNMKERLDFSCALFTADGALVANAPHIPVHLGAMQEAVKFQVKYWENDQEGIREGDVLMSNHPQLAGGSHLPDITVITPVFHNRNIIFFLASRGHHADIGGIAPGSMPPHSKLLAEEGAMIIAFKLVRDGEFQEKGISEILMSPGKLSGNSGSRNLQDNISDLRAQVAANNTGIRLMRELVEQYGLHVVQAFMKFIQKNAEMSVRTMLKDFALEHGPRAEAIDFMDDGTPIKLTIDIDKDTGSSVFDFTGTGPQVLGNHNAPPSVTYSAVIYSLRSLLGLDIPLNQGCLSPITFKIPKNCLLNPSDDAGVVGGNVLTSQRVVDVVLLAFKACAASQGCMNNLTFGDSDFGYYETIAGGAGAGPTWQGRSGVHTHCTNTRITDPEILERRYPVLLREFSIREGSGGNGKNKGGCGLIREIELLRKLTVGILSERRTLQPYGLEGGEAGERGRNLIVKKDGLVVNIGGKCSTSIDAGDRIRIETPGGGGYGSY